MDDRYIGVFDSGLGGITVLNELKKYLPHERFVFLADTKRSPYGEKTIEELYKIVFTNIETLISYDVKMIVFACNTASSLDLDYIRSKTDVPIVTVLEATLEEVSSEDKNILVAATEATIKSEKHKKLIQARYPSINVEGVACKNIVPYIEFEDLNEEEAQNVVGAYIKPYASKYYDSLVLGCTHYPIWTQHFANLLPQTRIINPAEKTAKICKNLLEKHNMLQLSSKADTSDDFYLVTSDEEIFRKKIKKIFGLMPKNVQKIHII